MRTMVFLQHLKRISLFGILFFFHGQLKAFSSSDSDTFFQSGLRTTSLPTLPSIQPDKVSISGISSGAFFAVQMHVAYSSRLKGVGILAGGPYYCALNNVEIAQHACMTTPENIDIFALVRFTKNAILTGTVDRVSNLENSKVWIYSGLNDTVVNQGVVKKTEQFYNQLVGEGKVDILSIYDHIGEHALVTNNFGNECTYKGEPWINNCDFDAAGSILNHIYGAKNLEKPRTSIEDYNNLKNSQLLSFDQRPFIPKGYTASTASLGETGYVFIPDQCLDDSTECLLHVVFHGCLQSAEYIGDVFAKNTGYNEWAIQNNIIVLYPQTKSNTLNPKGCYDWWGYTGVDYACKLGAQQVFVMNMINTLIGK